MLDLQSMAAQGTQTELQNLPDLTLFRISTLGYGARNEIVVTGWTYGVKLWHNTSRVRVRMDGGQEMVTFGEGESRRQFTSQGTVEMNYPLEVMVVPVIAGADGTPETLDNEGHRSHRRDDMDAKQEKALNTRYQFAVKQLKTATESGDADKAEMAQGRIDAITTEAEAAGVKLTMDGAVKSKGEEMAEVAAKSAEKRKANLKPSAAEVTQTKDAKLASADAARAAKGTAKAEKAKAAPKLAVTRDCLCGCGLETGSKFRPGHDAKVKGWLTQVERGLYAGGFAALPDTLKPYVKFSGKEATAGKDNQTYALTHAPVKFPGRPEITLTNPS